MKTDRELLGLAAKAASIEIIRSRLDDPIQKDMLVKNSIRNPYQVSGPWNPLIDDGDALRLAVKLELHVLRGIAQTPEGDMYFDKNESDEYAATRRAIVLAAAAIAEATHVPTK